MAAEHDTKLRDAFLPEAKAGWQKYVSRVTRYEAAVRTQLTNVLTGEVRTRGCGTVAVSEVWALGGGYRSSPHSQTSGGWAVNGINSAYSFRLVRDAEDADWRVHRLEWLSQDVRPHSLEELEVPPKNPVVTNAEDQTVWHSQMRTLCQGLMLSGIWFPSMIESPDFVLLSVDNVESEGEPLLRVQFDYVPDDPFLTRVRGGFVLLDPNRYWLIRGARTKGDWGEGSVGEIIISVEFDSSLDELPLPVHRQEHWIGITEEGESVHNLSDMWFEGWKRSSENEADFRLTAFGLPEPQPPKRQPRTWIWIAFHAVVGGCLAIWYSVRKRETL
jgi:hypothetical protein